MSRRDVDVELWHAHVSPGNIADHLPVSSSPRSLPGGLSGARIQKVRSVKTVRTSATSKLTLNSATGVISGTPTDAGNYSFTVTATFDGAGTVSAAYTLNIAA